MVNNPFGPIFLKQTETKPKLFSTKLYAQNQDLSLIVLMGQPNQPKYSR